MLDVLCWKFKGRAMQEQYSPLRTEQATIQAKSLGTLSQKKKKNANSRILLHPLCNVDLKRPPHPESLQVLSTLLGGGGGRAVTKTV